MTAHDPEWELFPHEADVGVRGRGATKDEAFESAAMALTAVITKPEWVEARETVEIECAAPDDELLLVDWLNALVYEMSTRKMLFGRYDVTLSDGALKGAAHGEKVDIERHKPAVEVKGATYTCVRVAREADTDRWIAQCVVDV